MNIRPLQNTDSHSLETFLSGHPDTSMFLRGNILRSGISYKTQPYHGYYLGYFDKLGEINGVIAQFWNGNIMMQSPDEQILAALCKTLKGCIPQSVAGLVGEDQQVKKAIALLGLTNEEYSINRSEGLYTLDLSRLHVPELHYTDTMTVSEANELNGTILSAWFKAYEIEALGSVEDETLNKRIADRVSRTLASGDCWVLWIEGTPVSMCGFNSRILDSVQIGPVWTPPEHRCQGYARRLLAHTLETAQRQGVVRAILFTDNPAAIRAYQSIGFSRTGNFRLALLKRAITMGELDRLTEG